MNSPVLPPSEALVRETGEAPAYLFSELGGKTYAVEIAAVSEVLPLPPITALHEVPASFSGVVYLRDQFVLVLNLAECLNLTSSPYSEGDALIVLEFDGHRVGIVVNEVFDVRPIALQAVQPLVSTGNSLSQRCVRALARSNGENVQLLDLEGIFGQAASYHARVSRQPQSELTESAQPQAEATPMAVVALRGEFFAVEVRWIREFAPLGVVTPVPYCPPSVVGLMNLRGEILTLVDISPALHLTSQPNPAPATHVVVIEYEDWVVGVLVDEVLDIFPLAWHQVTAALSAENDEPLRGTTWFGEKMLGVLDVPRLLGHERHRLEERL